VRRSPEDPCAAKDPRDGLDPHPLPAHASEASQRPALMIGAALWRERSLPAIDRSWEGNGAGVEARLLIPEEAAPQFRDDCAPL
jgi:hypothetical protein